MKPKPALPNRLPLSRVHEPGMRCGSALAPATRRFIASTILTGDSAYVISEPPLTCASPRHFYGIHLCEFCHSRISPGAPSRPWRCAASCGSCWSTARVSPRWGGRGGGGGGVTAEMASGSNCVECRLWSRALWERADKPDGILYRSRHDDSALCVAVYDRARDGLAIVRDHSLAEASQQMARLLRRYGLGLTA